MSKIHPTNPGDQPEVNEFKIESGLSAGMAQLLGGIAAGAFSALFWPLGHWLAVPVLAAVYWRLGPSAKRHAAGSALLTAAGMAGLQLGTSVPMAGMGCAIAFMLGIFVYMGSRDGSGGRYALMLAVRNTAICVGIGLLVVCVVVIAAQPLGLHPEHDPSIGKLADLFVAVQAVMQGTLGIHVWSALAMLVLAAPAAVFVGTHLPPTPRAARAMYVLAGLCAFVFAVNERGTIYRDIRHEREQAIAAAERKVRTRQIERAQKDAAATLQNLHSARRMLVKYAFLQERVATLPDVFKIELYALIREGLDLSHGSEALERLARDIGSTGSKLQPEAAYQPALMPIDANLARVSDWISLKPEQAVDRSPPDADIAAMKAELERLRSVYGTARMELVQRFETEILAAEPLLAARMGVAQTTRRTKMTEEEKAQATQEEELTRQNIASAAIKFLGVLLDTYYPWKAYEEGSAPVHDVASAIAWARQQAQPETWEWIVYSSSYATPTMAPLAVARTYLSAVEADVTQRAARARLEAEVERERARAKRELEMQYGYPLDFDSSGNIRIRGYGSGSSGGSSRGGGRFGIRRAARRSREPERLAT